MSLKIIGVIEISLDDVKTMIDQYIQKRYGTPVTRVEVQKGKVLAYIDHAVKEDAVMPLVSAETKAPQKPKTAKAKSKKTKTGKFKHQWSGLYGAVGEVIEKQRSRRKKFISFDDILAELLEMKDSGGNLLFVKGNEPLPMSVLKQRLAPSQVERQSKTQPNLEGITHEQTGLKI